MGRKKVFTRVERDRLRAELQDAEEALRRTDELLADEPTSLRDGVEARERMETAQSELVRVRDVARNARQTPGLGQLLADADRAEARAVPLEFDSTAAQAVERVAAVADRLDDFDRELTRNRPDRASDTLEDASEQLRAARTDKERLQRKITELKEDEEKAPGSDWLDTITSLIPIEVIAGWTAIQGIVGGANPTLGPSLYWVVFAVVLVATYLHVQQDFRDEPDSEVEDADDASPAPRPTTDGTGRRRPDLRTVGRWSKRVQVALAVGAFVVWVYYLGGPFTTADLHDQTLAEVLLPLYTLAGVQLVSSYTTILAGLDVRLRQAVGAGG